MFVLGITQPLVGHQLEVMFTASGLIIAVWASAYFSYVFFALGPVPRWVDAIAVSGLLLTVAGYAPYHSTRSGGTAAIGIVALGVVLQCTLCARMTLVPERRL